LPNTNRFAQVFGIKLNITGLAANVAAGARRCGDPCDRPAGRRAMPASGHWRDSVQSNRITFGKPASLVGNRGRDRGRAAVVADGQGHTGFLVPAKLGPVAFAWKAYRRVPVRLISACSLTPLITPAKTKDPGHCS
jgi:hypothetical protein